MASLAELCEFLFTIHKVEQSPQGCDWTAVPCQVPGARHTSWGWNAAKVTPLFWQWWGELRALGLFAFLKVQTAQSCSWLPYSHRGVNGTDVTEWNKNFCKNTKWHLHSPLELLYTVSIGARTEVRRAGLLLSSHFDWWGIQSAERLRRVPGHTVLKRKNRAETH